MAKKNFAKLPTYPQILQFIGSPSHCILHPQRVLIANNQNLAKEAIYKFSLKQLFYPLVFSDYTVFKHEESGNHSLGI